MGTHIATSAFGQFMASTAGRLVRVALGLALIALGWYLGGTTGFIVAAIGLVPLVAGALGVCLLTGLLAGLWTGDAVRDAAVDRAR